ncbi:hypothetical protein DSO57_1011914 [Entomophthora muscae]|uniref:Uncharacterized protein n=1 Tax=Entomophthora muscae TaxID=34485 RepID=A0ACC2SJ47_9FUNG|nr:hypothetical protein DSO57_1011914 [Entomophthora muscae]
MVNYLYNYNIIPGDQGFEVKQHPVKPFHYKKEGPKQTNRWWQNLVLGSGNFTVALYPYLMQNLDSGVRIGYPTITSSATNVISHFVPNWEVDFGKGTLAKSVVAEDDLSCTLQFGNVVSMPLVRGSPYVTMEVENVRPTFKTIHAILNKTQNSDRQTVVELNNGQVWTFFTSAPAKWTHSLGEMHLDSLYNGTIRVALVQEPVVHNLIILETHSTAYPISGNVTYNFPSKNKALINFNFNKKGKGDLLMFTLPHQQDVLVEPHRVDLKGYSNIKGPLSAIKGSHWTIKEELTDIKWSSPNKINRDFILKIKEAVRQEHGSYIDAAITGVYSFGKVVARFARMALIADEVGETSSRDKHISSIKAAIEPWLTGNNTDALVYDKTWGGLITTDSLKDYKADFGNAMYNDHHFHYGYFLYAAAVVGKYDPAWLEKWKKPLILLVRDFASPDQNDKYFPRFRQKDFYDGHSWASGIYEFYDNRNQESTSESVNGYYGMYLLGVALKNCRMTKLANLLLMTEIRSAKTYWHMYSGHSVYPKDFSKQKTVGIVWGTKVDYATWFGSNAEYIHGIQLLPFTPISHLLLDKPWMEEAYPVMANSLTRPQPPILGGWRTYIHMARAIIHPKAAYADFESSPRKMDDGNTLTNTLYWFATQKSE